MSRTHQPKSKSAPPSSSYAKYNLFLAAPMIDNNPFAEYTRPANERDITVRMGDRNDWQTLKFSDAIDKLAVWSHGETTYVSPIKGVTMGETPDVLIDMSMWGSRPVIGCSDVNDLDFPYVRVPFGVNEVVLEPPKCMFNLPSIRNDLDFVLNAARFDVIPKVRERPHVHPVQCAITVCGTGQSLREHIEVCVSGAFRLQETGIAAVTDAFTRLFCAAEGTQTLGYLWVTRAQSGQLTAPVESLGMWVTEFCEWVSQRKVAELECAAVLAYLCTPFTRASLKYMHGIGVRVPLNIVQLRAARGRSVNGNSRVHLDFDETCTDMPTAYFAISHHVIALEPWWDAKCHARWLQATCLTDKNDFHIFANRHSATLVQVAYATPKDAFAHSHATRAAAAAAASPPPAEGDDLVWHNRPQRTPGEVLPDIACQFTDTAPPPLEDPNDPNKQ